MEDLENLVSQSLEKLGGKFEDKEFLTTELTVLRCTKCGYYMLFDKMAQFTTKEESKS